LLSVVKYKGLTVKAGVKWTTTKESITITCYPQKKSAPYKLHTRSWKNYCPSCRKSGKLDGVGEGKLPNGRKKWGTEGGVNCRRCDADYCGVTGKCTGIGSKHILKPAASISRVNASASSVAAAQCELTQSEALAQSKSFLNKKNKSKYSGTLIGPMLKKLGPEQYCQLQLDKFNDNRKNIFWIDTVKVDIDNQTMTSELLESMPIPTTEYKDNSGMANVTTTSKAITGIKADTAIERTIMLKGKQLGSVDKIYKWLRSRGEGKWLYTFYYNHWKNKGSALVKDTKAMETCWKNKKANCTDFAWIFYTMCLGIGIKVKIIHGTAYFNSKPYGHLWNKYGSNIYDCSSSSGASKYLPDKVVI